MRSKKPEHEISRAVLTSRRTLLFSGLAFGISACAPANNLVGVETDPPITREDVEQRGHRIYIVTTRQPSDTAGEFFSNQRSKEVNFAAVDVVVPPNHQAGKVERPIQLPPDPDKHFVITNPQTFENHAAYKVQVDRDFRALPRGRRDGLLWIHGYNTTLTDAVLRLAQFVEDSGYQGVPILYSWASHGSLTGYVYDMNSALIARDYLEDVPQLLSQGEIEGLDVIAHSMGNFLTMEAIRGISGRGLFDTTGKLRDVILASPDIDVDLFLTQLRAVPREDRGFYVLTSSDDRALSFSEFLARRPRTGQLHPDRLVGTGLNVIDLSEVADTSSIHHAKFADAPEIVKLIGTRVLAGDNYAEGSRRGVGESIVIGASGAIYAIDEVN